MIRIEPIGRARQREVIEATAACIRRAGEMFGQPFALIPVFFDLAGRSAGMYRVRGQERLIRYNPFLFAKYFDDNLAVTVPHEVAHYVADQVYGLRNIRAHGREWRALMHAFGVSDSVTCSYDLAGVPVRRHRRYSYRCGCTSHQLTAVRHNRARAGARYICRRCGCDLAFVSGVPSLSIPA